MAGAGDEREPGPAAGEPQQPPPASFQVFPERPAQEKPQQGLLSSFFTHNQKCQLMLLRTLQTSRSRDPEAGGRRGGTCVRDRAILSILAVRNISREIAEKAVDEVFESCFNDHEPFGRIPHSKIYAKYAHRDFQNRDRYYSNI
ncbi:PREDICTED: mitochondrial inner membrane protease ATP23 homolog [Dipodomys ordii]|uniref:Mitochondrial inner membrane protease ATP23 n=1 Tax=Dipodomys ordii TaxID=10020 RepID=A0A1S3FB82_DIPOR|nr:PREDICTED: mitochondrial inner membrane protease ATP23 homolog [Dipodomys ordii]